MQPLGFAHLMALAERQDLVWTTADILTCGTTPDQLRGCLARSEWQRVHRGAYCLGGAPPTVRQRARAAVLSAGDDAVVSHLSAARLYGWPLIDDDATAGVDDVTMRSLCRRSRSSLRCHCRGLGPGDVVELAGLLVTSPARTLADLAGMLGHAAAVCAVDAATHRGDVRLDELRRWEPAQWPMRLWKPWADVLSVADDRAESPLETLVRLPLLAANLPLVPQVRVYDQGRVVARLDLGDEERRFAVEADGFGPHSSAHAIVKDRERDLRVARLGWRTVRFGWHDARGRTELMVRRATELYALPPLEPRTRSPA